MEERPQDGAEPERQHAGAVAQVGREDQHEVNGIEEDEAERDRAGDGIGQHEAGGGPDQAGTHRMTAKPTKYGRRSGRGMSGQRRMEKAQAVTATRLE